VSSRASRRFPGADHRPPARRIADDDLLMGLRDRIEAHELAELALTGRQGLLAASPEPQTCSRHRRRRHGLPLATCGFSHSVPVLDMEALQGREARGAQRHLVLCHVASVVAQGNRQGFSAGNRCGNEPRSGYEACPGRHRDGMPVRGIEKESESLLRRQRTGLGQGLPISRGPIVSQQNRQQTHRGRHAFDNDIIAHWVRGIVLTNASRDNAQTWVRDGS
jgi:hypothetical protein